MDFPTMGIPTVDFSKSGLKPGSPEWNCIRHRVKEALVQYGWFVGSFDGVCTELGNAVIDSLPELFKLPLKSKLANSTGRHNLSYLASEVSNNYQSLGFDDSTVPEKVESIIKLILPDGNPAFCKNVESYAEKLSEVHRMVHRMVLESFGLERFLEDHIQASEYHLRVIEYQLPPGKNADSVLPIHTDKGFITIIYQNQVQGLEMEVKDEEWIKCPAKEFIVMVGDSFHAWTNGRLRSPRHRAFLSEKNTRYSIVLFAIPKLDYTIEAPKELIDEQNPLLYKPFNISQYVACKEWPKLKSFSAI